MKTFEGCRIQDRIYLRYYNLADNPFKTKLSFFMQIILKTGCEYQNRKIVGKLKAVAWNFLFIVVKIYFCSVFWESKYYFSASKNSIHLTTLFLLFEIFTFPINNFKKNTTVRKEIPKNVNGQMIIEYDARLMG